MFGEHVLEGVFFEGKVEEAAEDEADDSFGVGFGVEEGEGGAPAAAGDDYFFNADVVADKLHVLNQVGGGVFFQQVAGRGLAAATLVEEKNVVEFGVEKVPNAGTDRVTGTPVKVNDGDPVWVAKLFKVNFDVGVADAVDG